MWRRRRRRWTGPATGVLLTGAVAVTLVAAGVVALDGSDRAPSSWRLVVRDEGGITLVETDLEDGRFALRYRNSVYGSRAEERFSIGDDGRIHLVGLAADEAAVLGEYYNAREPRPVNDGGALRWEAEPAYPVAIGRLMLAATDLGERSLVVNGHEPIELWRLVADSSPGLTLGAESVR